MLNVSGLLQALDAAGVNHVLIGGLAVNAHGVIRSTKDVDIVPAPDRDNLRRLSEVLVALDARQLGVGEGDLGADEMPFDPTRVEDLAEGGNFRLQTTLGVLDIMQWVPGIDVDSAFDALVVEAETVNAFGIGVRVCSLAHLRQMKRTAGRPQDLQDLSDLDAAHPPG